MILRRELLLAAATIGLGILLWNTHKVAVDDQAHYITSGINLVSGQGFTNPAGEPETWFPPLFPLLIGLTHLVVGDGLLAAKLLSLCASVVWVLAVHRLGRRIAGDAAGLAAAAILVALPVRAMFSVLSMSQALFGALLWSAVAAYVADLKDERRRTAPLVGLLLGLAALTRPEGLLVAALVVADRAARSWPDVPRRAWRRAATMAAVAAIVVLPYSVYLYRTTGVLAVTGKSAINLAVGRAHTAGVPLYRVDPESLAVEMIVRPGGLREVVRYARNLREEVRLLAGQLDYVWLWWAGLGAWLLMLRRGNGAATVVWAVAPLVVMPAYVMAGPFVVPYLPAFALAAGAGIVHAWQVAVRRAPGGPSPLAAGVIVVASLAWAAAGAAQDLRSFLDPGREAVAEKLAGEWLSERARPEDAVAAIGGTVAYHSGLLARRLTSDPLPLVAAYLRAQNIKYLALSDRDASSLHPSVLGLLRQPDAPDLRLLHTTADPVGSVCRVFAVSREAR